MWDGKNGQLMMKALNTKHSLPLLMDGSDVSPIHNPLLDPGSPLGLTCLIITSPFKPAPGAVEAHSYAI